MPEEQVWTELDSKTRTLLRGQLAGVLHELAEVFGLDVEWEQKPLYVVGGQVDTKGQPICLDPSSMMFQVTFSPTPYPPPNNGKRNRITVT